MNIKEIDKIKKGLYSIIGYNISSIINFEFIYFIIHKEKEIRKLRKIYKNNYDYPHWYYFIIQLKTFFEI